MRAERRTGGSPGGLAGPEDLPAPGSRVHMVGVGGDGMRGLAHLLADAGYRVSGCDRSGAPDAPELRERGVELLDGHDPAHVAGAALVIHTAAVAVDHPELGAAREAGVPVAGRARATGAVLNGHRLAGVTGTHGKTTTTAMAALACEAGGLEPTALVGGRVPAWDAYARTGGDPAVAEADEYDRSFLELDPDLAVVTSVEPEHLDAYGSVDALEDAFAEFAARASGRDGVLYCADDEGAARVVGGADGAASYGTDPTASYHVEERDRGGVRRCTLFAPEGRVETALPAPGEHNLLNAAAALATALRLGAEPGRLNGSLDEFTGVDRRLQLLVDRAGVAVVDDYAHHPTEVRAALSSLRARYPDRRLVAVFQPHLFSRTRDFAGEFAGALAGADRAVVLPVYPAREEPIPGVDSELITAAADEGGLELAAPEDVAGEEWLDGLTGADTVVVYMGAGDVTELARAAARRLAEGTGGRP